MVGRHDEEDRPRVALQRREGGDGDGGRGVAPERLEDDGSARDAEGAHLLGDDEAMLLVGDDDRRLEQGLVADPQGRLLQHGLRSDQGQELLRIGLPRQGPEAGPGAAGQEHGNDLALFGHEMLFAFSQGHPSRRVIVQELGRSEAARTGTTPPS